MAENRPCLSQGDTVVGYLARYTHRIAISNGRLLTMEDDRVSFRYKDYRDGSRIKTQWLEGQEFVRRFLMHILPKGFMRIRHFGYLSNRTRRRKLAVIRHCLSQRHWRARRLNDAGRVSSVTTVWFAWFARSHGSEQRLCQRASLSALIQWVETDSSL